MATLTTLSATMQTMSLRVSGDIDRVVRAVALAIDQAVVITTPVDTGRARSNWLVSVGSPNTSTQPPYAPGTGGSTGQANISAALAQGRAAVLGAGHKQTIYISNSLPYIDRLNKGYSAQAPAGYVQRAVEAAASAVKAAFP